MAATADDRSTQRDRMAGLLWGTIVGDALGVPVHWYYSRKLLKRDYGEVTGYVDCKHPHPESFMSGHGYHGKANIFHDKLKYVEGEKQNPGNIDASKLEEGPYHYHNGLKAGDTSADIYVLRMLLRMIVKNKEYREDAYLEEFKSFFLTPGSHPDTYLGVYIRRFFENLENVDKIYNAGHRQYDDWSVIHAAGMLGGFPVALLNHKRPTQALARAIHHVNLTNRAENLTTAMITIIPMVFRLIGGADARSELLKASSEVHLAKVEPQELKRRYMESKGPHNIPKEEMWYIHSEAKEESFDVEKYLDMPDEDFVSEISSVTCYAEFAVPNAFFFAVKYFNDFEKALLASTNCGGDTCGRNGLLGAVMGAVVGLEGIPKRLIDGLIHKEEIEKEINAFLDLCFADGK